MRISTYQLLGGPFDGEHREVNNGLLTIQIPVYNQIHFQAIVCSDLPVTAPRSYVHEYTLEYSYNNATPRQRVYYYQYRGVKEAYGN